MNPSLNKRTDEYGNQSLENRCRFNLEVIREMRKNMPEDMPLLMRLDAIDEMLPAVTTVDETVEFIGWAQEAGLDAIDLSRGNARSLATVYEVPPYNLEPGFNMDNIAAIKARVNIPVIGVGRIVDPALADQLIREGKIDMVAVGRAQLADPEWCNKSMEGREAEIRRCIDTYAPYGSYMLSNLIVQGETPEAGREASRQLVDEALKYGRDFYKRRA